MTDQPSTQNRDLARLQTALTDLDALQRDLFTAKTQAARAGIWNSFHSTLDEAYAAAWMHSIDRVTDKRTLWALRLDLLALHARVYGVHGNYSHDDYPAGDEGVTVKITCDGYWRAFHARVWGAYERVSMKLFTGSDLTTTLTA